MKELSIQEKATRYDEALKEAVIAHKDEDRNLKATLERIFPELKESYDERIMENIIATIHLYYGEPLEDEAKEMIDWLEKQGEQKIKTPEESLGIDSDTYNKIVDECIYGEQNPAWSEEDEAMLAEISDLLWEGYKQSGSKFSWDDIRNWVIHKLKSLRPQKQCCNDVPSREYILNVWELGNYWKELTKGVCSTEHGTQLEYIQNHWKEGEYYDKIIVCPQKQWKPSDEQIDTLEYYMHNLICNEHKEVLFGLYADLKKLM